MGVIGLSQGLVSCGLFGDREVSSTTGQAAQISAPERKSQVRRSSSNSFSDGIAATVNGKVITKSEVRQAIEREKFLMDQQLLRPGERERRLKALEDEGLDALIERVLILAEYDKRGFPVKPQHVDAHINSRIRQQFGGDREKLVEALRRSGITMRKFREDQEKAIKILRMKMAVARDKTRPPSPKEVQAYYNKNINDYRDEGTLRVRTITIPKRSRRDREATEKSQQLLAQDIHHKVKRGGNFAELAQTYSEDSAARNGGDRGVIDKQTLSPLLTINAFNLEAGETSEIIEDARNYYILKVDSRQYGKAQPLSEVREEIEASLVGEQREEIVSKWVAGLRRRALIKQY
jgi:parvulin-like peptidyl-prolyl isomerase